ncbi:MAG: AbgT family transporter, partial [Calditrichaeota bacterium]|nr:AbgT family transporter [Calditrichota bacterium]
MTNPNHKTPPKSTGGWINRMLNMIEAVGNKLPDPAMLFLIAMLLVWVFSAILAPV